MASFGALSTTTWAQRTNTTVDAPAGVQNGNVLLLGLVLGDPAGPPSAPTLPSGFQVISGPASVADPSSFTATRRLAWKVASNEPSSYLIEHAALFSQAVVLSATSAASSTPVVTDNNGLNNITTALDVTTPTDDSLVVFFVHNWNLYGGADPPAGTTPTFTERLDQATSLFYVATGELATAGPTGNKTHDNLNVNASDPWAAWLVAIGNAVAPGGNGDPDDDVAAVLAFFRR